MNQSQATSWLPLILVAAAAFVSALDATFMNVSISQLVMMVTAGLMVLGCILPLTLKSQKKRSADRSDMQKGEEDQI